MSQTTESLSAPSLREFNTVQLLNADLKTMSDDELRALVRQFQQSRANPHETTRMKKTAEKKAKGTHIDPTAGLL